MADESTRSIDLPAEHRSQVLDIIRRRLPEARVWVYGSRAKGRARRYSDLDLMLDDQGRPISAAVMGNLDEDFDESDLPIIVEPARPGADRRQVPGPSAKRLPAAGIGRICPAVAHRPLCYTRPKPASPSIYLSGPGHTGPREVSIMQWASALSQQNSLRAALSECAASVRATMGDTAPDLAVVFASSEYASDYANLPDLAGELLGRQAMVLGCSGGGIIGGGSEVEQEPAVSLTVASLPGVNIHPIRLEGDNLPSLDAGPNEWHEAFGVNPADEPQFVLLVDPMSFPAQNLLLGMDYAYPAAAKIGGLASAAQGASVRTASFWGRTTTTPARWAWRCPATSSWRRW